MKYVIGLDIGGTKTIGAVFNELGTLIEKKRIPTNAQLGKENLLQSLYVIIEDFIKKYNVKCISIASAGRINVTKGQVHYASDNIPGWIGLELKKIMESKFDILTIVENDCNATGIGEEWLGNAKNKDSYVMFALGTGVGAAVKLNGNMLHGESWSAGELGHMIIHPNGRQCNCGLKGCLEQYCSGPSLVKAYNEVSQNTIKTGYDFFNLVRKSDKLAKSILDKFTDDLSTAIISLANIYDPTLYIIGGGLVETKEFWWDDLIDKINKSTINNIVKLEVRAASLGSNAALYGAGYLGLKAIGMI